MRLFCKHNWKILDKTITPSPFEQMNDGGLKKLKAEFVRQNLFAKKVVYLMQCEECKKTKLLESTKG